MKSLELSYDLLFAEARHKKARTTEFNENSSMAMPYTEDLEERIRQILEGQEISFEDHE